MNKQSYPEILAELQNIGHENLGVKVIQVSRLNRLQEAEAELESVIQDIMLCGGKVDDTSMNTLRRVQNTLKTLGKE